MATKTYNLSDAVQMKMIRRFHGYTIEEMGRKLNCSGSQISYIENGLKPPKKVHESLVKDFEKLSEMYNLLCSSLYKSYDKETADKVKNYFDLIFQNL